MDNWVVDSSVAAKWVLAEPDSVQALRVVTDTAARAGQLYVLDLDMIEVTNVICALSSPLVDPSRGEASP